MTREMLMIPAFEDFIHETSSGKRMKANGEKIKPQSMRNYWCVLNHLKQFEVATKKPLRIRPVQKSDKRIRNVEKNYWTKFYRQFADYLYKQGCYDNYVGNQFKIIRTFFLHLNRNKLVNTGDFYKSFYVRKEEIPILILEPRQLSFLISNEEFNASMPRHLRRIKDIFVFGCTVGVRFSDLFNIAVRDIEVINQTHYLSIRTIKTGTAVKVKLPPYAVDIVQKYAKRKKSSAKIFNPISLNQFNMNLKHLMELAGWTNHIGKSRNRNGKIKEVIKDNAEEYRFCDLASSHLMRRTAVTTMLILGMPESAVRKISGHAANSAAFYRYVNYVQAYLDQEIDKVHAQLISHQ